MNGYLCYHHNDMDGKAAANEVYKALVEKGVRPNAENFIMKDYASPYSQEDYSNKEVFIVDLSFTKNNIGTLMEICEYASSVVWIDHHKSSIECIKDEEIKGKLSEYSNLKYFVNNNACGAVLAMHYFDVFLGAPAFSSAQSLEYDFEYTKNFDTIKTTYPDGSISLTDIPYYLKLIDLWDRWVYGSNLDPVFFSFGCQARNTSLFTLATKNSTSKTYNKNFWGVIDQRYVISAILADGKICKRYADATNRSARISDAYEARIDGWKGLVLNSHGNSTAFGPMFDKYDIVCLWHYNGKFDIYQYSLYSSNENVDCAKIAQKYDPNGGGHKGAAGFSSKELLFRSKK